MKYKSDFGVHEGFFSRTLLIVLIALFSFIETLSAQSKPDSVESGNPNQMRIPAREEQSTEHLAAFKFPTDVRTVDGSHNNLVNSSWGRSDIPLLRLAPADYAGGHAGLSGPNRPSPRDISNAIIKADGKSAPVGSPVSDMFWQWGQFLDHDLTLTPEIHPVEHANISIPVGDPWFDPNADGGKTMQFGRSNYSVDKQNTRQQHNFISAYVDASNVYGSDKLRATALRSNDGTGRLKVSDGNLLPFNIGGLPNAPSSSANYFLAGDFRANEQIGLTALHTLFVREHNRIANNLRAQNPALSGKEIYNESRALVGALMQVITYNEFLPKLLGETTLAPYRGYSAQENASISNEFATAAYRVGHTMLSSQILRLGADGKEADEGHILLRNAYFNPRQIVTHGVDSVLRGLVKQRAQKIDVKLVDDVRNLLFGGPAAGGLDLASLNIQRGRDHGLSSYVETRLAIGLSGMTGFDNVTADVKLQNRLKSMYLGVNDIDLWVGGLAESPLPGAMVGETFHKILADQFRRLRDGDRFWYANHLPMPMIQWLEDQTLAKVIRRNTTIGSEISDDVFRVNGDVPIGQIIILLLDEIDQ